MRFSTIFTVLAAGAMAFAGAVPEIVAKRSAADITNALGLLSDNCDNILSGFNGCHDDTCSGVVVGQLVVAIKECTTTLGGLDSVLGIAVIAEAAVEVVTKISVGLETHKSQCGSGCPGLINIYADVDVSLKVWLEVLFGLCPGLLGLVTPLLVGLLVTLQNIWLKLVIKVCLL